jgi:hypothetical protein
MAGINPEIQKILKRPRIYFSFKETIGSINLDCMYNEPGQY